MENLVTLNSRGQTAVEYLLLLAVSTSLVLTFLNSNFVKTMFGDNGKIGQFVKLESEFSYRHALPRPSNGQDIPRENLIGTDHPSYYNGGSTRFFGPRNVYPQ